jgi:hypothetical protein
VTGAPPKSYAAVGQYAPQGAIERSDWMNRMETPGLTHSARPCATKRLARFFEVNRQSETGFSIRMFLHTVLVSAQVGLRVCPQVRAEGTTASCGVTDHPPGRSFARVPSLDGGMREVSRGPARLWGNAVRTFCSTDSARPVQLSTEKITAAGFCLDPGLGAVRDGPLSSATRPTRRGSPYRYSTRPCTSSSVMRS